MLSQWCAIKVDRLDLQIIEYNPALIERPPFRINVKTESPFLGDKLDVRLELVIEEVDENTCRQVFMQ